MAQRIAFIKKSTVRVIVNGEPQGSGFIISRDGLIATCFHVVQNLQPGKGEMVNVGYASDIKIEFNDRSRTSAKIYEACLGDGFVVAMSRDYSILKVPPSDTLQPIHLGNFRDMAEGDKVYTCCYPLKIKDPFVSFGTVSTKTSVSGYLGQGNPRDAALIDITLNKGNSGGPVLLMANDPVEDRVIGFASFILTPLSDDLKDLVNIVKESPMDIAIQGSNYRALSESIVRCFKSSSVGIGGCVSTDYLRKALEDKI